MLGIGKIACRICCLRIVSPHMRAYFRAVKMSAVKWNERTKRNKEWVLYSQGTRVRWWSSSTTSLDNKEQYSKGRNDLEWLCVEDQRRGFLNHRFVSSTFRFQNEKY